MIPLSPERLRKSIGGTGLGLSLLLDTESARLPALHPRASLFFVFSPLVGSPLTTSAKFAVVSKSPLTDRINDSLAGSGFAIAGKKTGFDAIEIVGRASEPTVVVIQNENVRFVPAGDLWGMPISDAEQKLKVDFGGYRAAVIGPAGENLVRYATISHDGRHAGRGGSGAVLGSKNLKAVLVKGDRQVKWAEPDELARYAKQLSQKSFGPATEKYRELGTAANLLAFNRLDCLPTRNFSASHFETADRLAPETLSRSRSRVRRSCAACTIGCEHLYSIRKEDQGNGEQDDSKVRLEYESLFALGPLCGIDDPETVLKAAQLCDELGLDTISAGGTIAFAMDCCRRGWLPHSLQFGNGDDLLRMLSEIGRREKVGEELADGSRILAQRIGNGALDFAPQIKGLEIPGYDPRKLSAMALGFAVGARGADHNKSSAYEIDFSSDAAVSETGCFPVEEIRRVVELEDRAAVMDSLIFCKFLRGVFQDFYAESAQTLRFATGWDWTADELKTAGATIVENRKQFNLLAGWTSDEDTLPASFFRDFDSPDSEKGSLDIGIDAANPPPSRFSRQELDRAVETYNAFRGWTSSGRPLV